MGVLETRTIEQRSKRTPEQAKAKLEEMAAHVERIAEIIQRRPVLGHWPHMQAHFDSALLIVAAKTIRSLGSSLIDVAAIGHKLKEDAA